MSFSEEKFGVANRVALVTGGYSGLGAAISLGLAAGGAKIAVAGIEGSQALAFAKMLEARGHEAYADTFDVLSAEATRRMVDGVVEHFGRLDIFVNSVGVNRGQPALEMSEDVFDQVLDVNLRGAFFQAQAAARHMIRQGTGGKQVHIGSVRSQLALRGHGYAAYCASKGGVVMLARQMAIDYARGGIRVNAVCPGWIDTPFNDPAIERAGGPEALVPFVDAMVPMGRQGQPDEVADVVAFLSSDDARLMTGAIVMVDGGLTAQ